MMDRLAALIAGIQYRDHATPDDPIRKLSDQDIMRLIAGRTEPGRPRFRPTVTYRDPTGDQACSNADRRR